MKKITKMAVLAVATGAMAASAQAQTVTGYTENNNELLLGFTTPSSTGDLVIDLGKASSIVSQSSLNLNVNGNIGQSATDLQSQLNSLYGGMANLSWGVVGGKLGGLSIYSTVPHGAAAPMSPGAAGQTIGAINTAGNALSLIGGGMTLNQAVVDPTQNYGDSWTEQVGPGTLRTSFGRTYYNPDSTTSGFFSAGDSQVEDLYLNTPAGETLLGTITLAGTGDVTWNATVVPEPTTLSLLGGLALLALSFRRQSLRN